MRRIGLFAALSLVVVSIACSAEPKAETQAQLPAAPPQSLEPLRQQEPTATTQPTAVAGPNGITMPFFKHPYTYGTPQQMIPSSQDGLVPVIDRVKTDKSYVFLTIDDGAIRHPAALELMRKSGIEPTLFLNSMHVEGHVDYFRAFQDKANSKIHSHTANHPNLAGQSYGFQRQEICSNAEYFQKEFASRPRLFRPPYGNYDSTTRKAAADCGFAGLIMWTATVNDGAVQFQIGSKLNPGDIVLMHFRETFVQDFLAFLEQAKKDGLTPVPLDDFLSSTAPSA